MSVIEIDGVGRVEVDSSFLSKSPEEQAAVIDEIVSTVKPDKFSTAAGLSREVLSSATFSLGGEAAGAGRAVGAAIRNLVGLPSRSAGEAFTSGRQEFRAPLDETRQESPIASAIAGVIGGFGGLRAAQGVAAQALPRLRDAAKVGVLSGAAGGTAAGFGESGEDTITGRLQDAAIGGVIGGTAGAVLPVGLAAGGRVANFVASAVGRKNADKAARQLVLRAMQRDGVTAKDALSKYNAWQSTGSKPETLADLAGGNLRGLARAVTSTPGSAKHRATEMLARRQSDQGARAADDIAQTMRLERRGYYEAIDELVESRRSLAAPAYERAYSAQAVWSDKLEGMLKRPSMKAAWEKARRIAADQGEDLPQVFTLDDAGNITGIREIPNARVWDFMKRGLDDVLQGSRNPLTGKIETDSGRAVDTLRRELLDELDLINPAYAEARGVFSSFSNSIDAAERGRQFAKGDLELTRKAFNELPDADKDFFRLGVFRQMRDTIANAPDGSDVVKRIFGSDMKRDRLRAVFPTEDAFEAFTEAMRRESRMFELRRVVEGGSPTARILEELSDAADEASTLETVLSGDHRGFLRGLWRGAVMRARNLSGETADKLGEMLFSTDQKAVRAAIKALDSQATAVAAGDVAVPAIAAVAGAQAASAGTEPTANQPLR